MDLNNIKKVKVPYVLNIDYKKLFGKSWYKVLKKSQKFMSSTYLYNLMIFLNEVYKNDYEEIVFPKKENLFENFRLTEFSRIKVVIIPNGVYPHALVGGCGINSLTEFGLPFFSHYWNTSIENALGTLNLNFSPTMNSYMKQGVFLLPSFQTASARSYFTSS